MARMPWPELTVTAPPVTASAAAIVDVGMPWGARLAIYLAGLACWLTVHLIRESRRYRLAKLREKNRYELGRKGLDATEPSRAADVVGAALGRSGSDSGGTFDDPAPPAA